MTKTKRHIPINTPNSLAEEAGTAEVGKGPQASQEQRSAEASRGEGAEASRGDTLATGLVGAAPSESAGAEEATPSEREPVLAEQDALTAERDILAAERDALAAERDALLDSLLRLKAEFDNFRKRVRRDLAEAQERGRQELLSEFLPVLDNLERALEAAERHEEGRVLEGVELTRKMFVDLLSRCGIEEVEGLGARFNPQVHEAVAMQPSQQEEGTVIAVLQRGYKRGDKLLRPARVVVSSGPGESQPAEGAATK